MKPPYEIGNSRWWSRKARSLDVYAERKGVIGHITGGQLRRLWDTSGRRCTWCNSTMNLGVGPAMLAATVDHVIELRNGGPHHIDNLAFACGDCNSNRDRRGATYLTDAA